MCDYSMSSGLTGCVRGMTDFCWVSRDKAFLMSAKERKHCTQVLLQIKTETEKVLDTYYTTSSKQTFDIMNSCTEFVEQVNDFLPCFIDFQRNFNLGMI